MQNIFDQGSSVLRALREQNVTLKKANEKNKAMEASLLSSEGLLQAVRTILDSDT